MQIWKTIVSGLTPPSKAVLVLLLLGGSALTSVGTYYYWKSAVVLDAHLNRRVPSYSSKVLAAPRSVHVGDRVTIEKIVSLLRNTGYSESRGNSLGYFSVQEEMVEIHPGRHSSNHRTPAAIHFRDGVVTSIASVRTGNQLGGYTLEPELITNLFDGKRIKRLPMRYEDIPPRLTKAILAIEDHRFFEHGGFDPIRTTKAAFDGIRDGRRPRGTSTLPQQLARLLFLRPEPTYRRKLVELWLAFVMESRLTKEQIFALYCNEVPLGRRDSFNIVGMGAAARVYFDQDVQDLTVAQAALLAGLIQRPSYLDPYRHPERARSRRNTVLREMLRHGYIETQEYQAASQESLRLAPDSVDTKDAPYFVDLASRQIRSQFGDASLAGGSYRIYTTLDMELQRVAVDAVRRGMAEVDRQVRRRVRPQCALVALDPRTGEIKALVGGRDYGRSQLNRALARRQPGSAFKPFVYAAAISTAVEGGSEILTAASTVEDEPTTFEWGGRPYRPANYADTTHGITSLRRALEKSMNIATVKVAERVGYDRVAELAQRAGMGRKVAPTPSIALGAYEVTPLEMAAAYTALANGGVRMDPSLIRLVRGSGGRTLFPHNRPPRQVLDPRVAYVVTHMLEGVLHEGTAVRVRAMGFEEPAAGKTGTDDDGWFVGYTSNLLCVVWVGFDDNSDLGLEGAKSALPIWTDFMKRAHSMRAYRDPKPFRPAAGVTWLEVDPLTGELASWKCPEQVQEVFIAGSEPTQLCRRHHKKNIFRRFVGIFRRGLADSIR